MRDRKGLLNDDHLEYHAGLTVGDAGHDEAGAVAEGDILGERQSLEMFGLPGSLGYSDFLHCLDKRYCTVHTDNKCSNLAR